MWTPYPTALSLSEWANEVQISPYLVAQITEPKAKLSRSFGVCETPLYQDAHQGADSLGRNQVAQAIQKAEQLIADWHKTFAVPTAFSDDVLYPRPANLTYRQLYAQESTRLKSIKLGYGNIISVGQFETTLIDADVAITTSDPYGDTFNTAFSASVAVPAGTTADEVRVYFSSADRFTLPLEECEIRPVSVSISGNTATITGYTYQLVRLNNYLKQAPAPLDAEASIYVTTLDVYRQTIDVGASGTLYWYTPEGCENPPCTYQSSTACFVPVNVKSGFVAPVPASFDEAEQEYVRLYPNTFGAPDRVVCNYISGIPRVNGKVAQPYARAIALLATALLANKTCGCQVADGIINRYRNPPENDQGTVTVDQEIFQAASMQFGNSGRGAIEAYALLAGYEVARNYESVVL